MKLVQLADQLAKRAGTSAVSTACFDPLLRSIFNSLQRGSNFVFRASAADIGFRSILEMSLLQRLASAIHAPAGRHGEVKEEDG